MRASAGVSCSKYGRFARALGLAFRIAVPGRAMAEDPANGEQPPQPEPLLEREPDRVRSFPKPSRYASLRRSRSSISISSQRSTRNARRHRSVRGSTRIGRWRWRSAASACVA